MNIHVFKFSYYKPKNIKQKNIKYKKKSKQAAKTKQQQQ